jgi:hypothetical protein
LEEVLDAPGGAFVSKDGVTWGQAASMVLEPDRRLAIVARHLLRPQIPLGGEGGTRY